jgi:hypothetical protein
LRIVVSRIRRALAAVLALAVTALTLGLVRVNRTGLPGAASQDRDPGHAAATRTLDGPRGKAG